MTRKILYQCDICGLKMDQEFSAHIEVYFIWDDKPRTDLCPRCWSIGMDAMKSAFEGKL